MFKRGRAPDDDIVALAARRLEQIRAEYAVAGPAARGPGVADAAADAETFGAEEFPEDTSESPATERPLRSARAGWPFGRPGRHVAPGPRSSPGRLGVTSHHVTVVALIVAAVVALAAWWVLRSIPQTEPVRLAADRQLMAPAVTQSSAPVTPSSTGQSPATLVVDVSGKVRRPGIVELPAGSRVIDALEAAGGPRASTNLTTLNLARPLVDGEQLLVGIQSLGADPLTGLAPGSAGSSSTGPVLVNLNTATQAELESLPGIGPVIAMSILSWREANAAFTSIDELLEVSGIGAKTFAELEAFVYV